MGIQRQVSPDPLLPGAHSQPVSFEYLGGLASVEGICVGDHELQFLAVLWPLEHQKLQTGRYHRHGFIAPISESCTLQPE